MLSLPMIDRQGEHLGRLADIMFALAAGTVLMAGCDQRPQAGSASAQVDRAANKVEAAVSTAADKTATVADDATITAKVKGAILAEPGLKSLQINVDTNTMSTPTMQR